jgi:type IV pilus assembly protein PilY1
VTKIFKAEYDDGSTIADQPSTTQPIAIVHPTEDEGFIIIFATGAYIREGDSIDPAIQSIYGIWDRLGPELITKAELVEQEYTNIIDELGRVRTLSANAVDYSVVGAKKGWFIDLDVPAAGDPVGSTAEFPGEKAIRNIQLRGGLAFVNSVFPRPSNSCVGQAGGATLAFCPDTGGSECINSRTIFDLNNDGYFNEGDNVGDDDNQIALGRILEDPAPPTDATFIGDKRVTQFGKELDIVGTNTSAGDNTGRLSWKRLESVD